VAVIEAGATALSKWWAAGLAAGVAGVFPAIKVFWENEDEATQRVLIIAIGIGIAAAVLAIGYIVGSDVRGRSAASVATIEARAKIADAVARLSESAYTPPRIDGDQQILALPAALRVCNGKKHGDAAEAGWRAIALRGTGDDLQYLLVKETEQDWVEQEHVHFVS
jgi:hypothetical protein